MIAYLRACASKCSEEAAIPYILCSLLSLEKRICKYLNAVHSSVKKKQALFTDFVDLCVSYFLK